MTVEEMIQEIEDSHKYFQSIHEGYGKQIIAALKAGQAMRNADDKNALCEAMVEWDAATKEDE